MKREVYKALKFSQKAHEGQVDKSGVQYFLHPVRVSYMALTDDEKIVALLHDVLEDTHYTVEDIKREVTNNDCIIQALELLNHDMSNNLKLTFQLKKNFIQFRCFNNERVSN